MAEDLHKQAEKSAKAVKEGIKAPHSEQAVTRDVTPSIEKPGKQPTRPERPQP